MSSVETMMTTGATISQPSCHSVPSTRRKVPVRLTGTVFRVGASVSATMVGSASGLLGQLGVRVHHLRLSPRLSVFDRHLVVDDLLDHVRECVLCVGDVEQPRLRRGGVLTDAPNLGDLLHLSELARLPEVAFGVIAEDRDETPLH